MFFNDACSLVYSAEVKEEDKPSEGFKKLQSLFLPVFWAFKLADWLHGPYFYQVCCVCARVHAQMAGALCVPRPQSVALIIAFVVGLRKQGHQRGKDGVGALNFLVD